MLGLHLLWIDEVQLGVSSRASIQASFIEFDLLLFWQDEVQLKLLRTVPNIAQLLARGRAALE